MTRQREQAWRMLVLALACAVVLGGVSSRGLPPQNQKLQFNSNSAGSHRVRNSREHKAVGPSPRGREKLWKKLDEEWSHPAGREKISIQAPLFFDVLQSFGLP